MKSDVLAHVPTLGTPRGSTIAARTRELWSDKLAFAGLATVLLFVLMALLAGVIEPYNPNHVVLTDALRQPVWAGGTWAHPFGTDNLGRDVLSRIIDGGQTTLEIVAVVVAVAGVAGTFVGAVSGFVGGWIDALLMRYVEVQAALPSVLLALVIIVVIRPGVASLVLVLTLDHWLYFIRISRGTVLSVRQSTQVESAMLLGCRPLRVLGKHVLPSLVAPMLTLAVLEFASVTLGEAGFSYLGFGVQPPQMSWGLEISDGQLYIYTDPWLIIVPGLALLFLVLGANLFGSWLRTTLNPVERQQRQARAVRGTEVRRDPGEATLLGEAEATSPLLAVSNLNVEFRLPERSVHAVRGVSFALEKGEMVGLVGESGSGKTITALSVTGLLSPPGYVTAGDIRWKGQSILGADGRAHVRAARGREFGIVFQDPASTFNPRLTIGRQLTEGMRRHLRLSRRAARQRACNMLDLVGISRPAARLHQYPHEFSGGMLQRVSVAMALACGPELLIADEATSALDVTVQAQIMELLFKIQSELRLTVLLICHDIALVAESCDRVLVMYGGTLVETGDVERVLLQPFHPYTEALVQVSPSVLSAETRLKSIGGAPPNLELASHGCPFYERCPIRVEKCAHEVPPLIEAEPSRRVACWERR